jgi:hypothetical protein
MFKRRNRLERDLARMRPAPSRELYDKLVREVTSERAPRAGSAGKLSLSLAAAAVVVLALAGLSLAGKGNPITDAVRAIGLGGVGAGPSIQQHGNDFEGCTPGFWKQAQHFDSWTTYSPSTTLGSVFTIPSEFSSVSGDSFLTALSYGGGSTDLAAAKLLLHHAVAALLNAASAGVNYPLSTAQVISQTNAALASSDRDTMLAQKDAFDANNNLGCSLN